MSIMICSQCNKEFVRDSNSQKYCKECKKIKRNERSKKCRQSDLGKETAYNNQKFLQYNFRQISKRFFEKN